MEVRFDPPPGPVGTVVTCPECGDRFAKAHPGHIYCTRRCRRRPEAERKKARDKEVEKPVRTSEERTDIIWNPTAEVLTLHANILLALKDGERGYTFGGEALDKVALPQGVSLYPAYGMARVWNLRLTTQEVTQVVLKPKRSVLDIMKAAKEGKILPTEGTI